MKDKICCPILSIDYLHKLHYCFLKGKSEALCPFSPQLKQLVLITIPKTWTVEAPVSMPFFNDLSVN